MGKKFVDKKKATTYSLVYRSQEDPLAFEEGSTQRVLVDAGRRAERRPAGRDEAQTLEKGMAALGLDDLGTDNVDERQAGTAALYGVYLDDRKYDYTKHLRAVGTGGGVIMEAPAAKEKKRGEIEIPDEQQLPAEVLPSKYRMDIKSDAVPQGLQPFMDTNVREALEALDEDDAEEFDDDFLDKLNADELSGSDAEAGNDDDDDDEFDPDDVFAQVQRMKARMKARAGSLDDGSSEAGRTEDTGFSMSSSAMFRNEKLTMLDEQFDRVAAQYEEESSDDGVYDSEGNYIVQYDSDGNEKAASSRPDFEAVLDEFLQGYELTGRRLEPVMEGGSGAGKLSTFRGALADEEETRRRVVAAGQRQEAEARAKTKAQDEAELDDLFKEKQRPAWDCESVLSTYSTLDNHPALISETSARIRVSRKSGFPVVEQPPEEDAEDDQEPRENRGLARPKGETAADKRARKKQLQEEKQRRREEKRETRGEYAEKKERRQQSRNDRRQHTVRLE
ncbi:Protein ltv1 [Coemansia sp. RSA 552]|nr:Protein ltv1 [Coemansia sp. RSA 552]